MKKEIINRVEEISDYILKTQKTIRETAKKYKISKSTVHKDLHERLVKIDNKLYKSIDKILKYHTNIRHIRGGEATKMKYQREM